MPEKRSKKLFAEFPPVSVGEWEDLIRVDLKGADYDRKLIWKTLKGLRIHIKRQERINKVYVKTEIKI